MRNADVSRLRSIVLGCTALVCFTPVLGAVNDGVPPEIVTHTNQVAAGRMANQSLYLDLEVQEGIWYPETKDGPGLLVQAFAERGKSPSIPGPLLRVREGTRVRASVHNSLSVAVALHGFHTRPGDATDVVSIPAGETRHFDFAVGAVGTYHYYGSTMEGGPGAGRPTYIDANLSGAFVVDPQDAKAEPDDRIFMIGAWRESRDLDRRLKDSSSAADRAQLLALQRTIFTINGLSWPYTQRLTYRESQPVRWRWINTSNIAHPMHLHGFYFDVESIGDGERDTLLKVEDRPHVVTQKLQVGGNLTMSWTPDRAGNWLFHCHMIEHISPNQRLRPATHAKHEAHSDNLHVTDGMAGLVLGIHVSPTADLEPRTVVSQRRNLQLIVHEQAGRFGTEPAMGYALAKVKGESAPNEVSLPGPTIVLTRGEPVSVDIMNTLKESTSVHWHGIEIDSYFDGVPGWGGRPGSVTPSIAPGASFVAEMTPPRAGTFIYHTHSHDDRQLTSGMYGALVVLEPGQRYDPTTDRLLLISVGGPNVQRLPPPDVPILLNGSADPKPMQLQVGVTYRLRIINITADNVAFNVHLLAGDEYVDWRPLAKDGADLPSAQRILKKAMQPVGVGETFDVEYRPERPGDLRFEVRTGAGATRIAAAMRVR